MAERPDSHESAAANVSIIMLNNVVVFTASRRIPAAEELLVAPIDGRHVICDTQMRVPAGIAVPEITVGAHNGVLADDLPPQLNIAELRSELASRSADVANLRAELASLRSRLNKAPTKPRGGGGPTVAKRDHAAKPAAAAADNSALIARFPSVQPETVNAIATKQLVGKQANLT